MNVTRARELLELGRNETSDIDAIKRQYRIKALMYHPDKNKSENATSQFRDIHEAYKLLSNNVDIGSSDKTYKDLLSDFLKSHNTENELFNMLLNRISQACEDKTLKFMKTLDPKILSNLYKLIVLYADVLHISDDFMREIDALVKKDECVVLNPKLSDIMSDNLYKLAMDGKTFLVPLWHHKLVYDNSGSDLYVVCRPTLPSGVTIDDDNNLIVELSYRLSELFEKERHEFLVGDTVFSFRRDELRMREHNVIVLANAGLAKINSLDMYSVSERSDIRLNVRVVK
jgi:curved DNA-binding protein CbpA